MKIALVTLLDDNFVIAFEGFWKSFIYHNKWFNYDFVIIDNGLSPHSKNKIISYYENTKFVSINKDNYDQTNFSRTHESLRATFYTFELFKLKYDRIVFMDMDLTVLADIKELFECDEGFAACKAYSAPQDRIIDTMFNSGVFVVQKKYLTMEIYNQCLRRSRHGCSMPDQRILNNIFRDIVYHLPKYLNVEKRMMLSRCEPHMIDEAKILHWVAEKPWNEKIKKSEEIFEELEKIWWHYYNMENING